MIVKIQDLRAARMCHKGARRFFERHGLDWRRFVREGLPESDFIKTGDAMAIRLVEVARGRQ